MNPDSPQLSLSFSLSGSVAFQPDIEAELSEYFGKLDTVTNNFSNLILEINFLSVCFVMAQVHLRHQMTLDAPSPGEKLCQLSGQEQQFLSFSLTFMFKINFTKKKVCAAVESCKCDI